ncbi:hypothetical protein E3P77_03149 [Wallemia ichthyophaga]|nr:hypothetical protein E3P77_03149 [Wallemia ichthyophaga]
MHRDKLQLPLPTESTCDGYLVSSTEASKALHQQHLERQRQAKKEAKLAELNSLIGGITELDDEHEHHDHDDKHRRKRGKKKKVVDDSEPVDDFQVSHGGLGAFFKRSLGRFKLGSGVDSKPGNNSHHHIAQQAQLAAAQAQIGVADKATDAVIAIVTVIAIVIIISNLTILQSTTQLFRTSSKVANHLCNNTFLPYLISNLYSYQTLKTSAFSLGVSPGLPRHITTMRGFLDLPDEIISHIIDDYLDLDSVYSLRTTNKRLLELSKSIILSNIQLRLFSLEAGVYTSKVIQSGLFSSRNCQSVHHLSLVVGNPTTQQESDLKRELDSSMDIADHSELSELIVRLQKLESVAIQLISPSTWTHAEKESFQRLLYSLATLRKLKDLSILTNEGLWSDLRLPPIHTLESLSIRGSIPNKSVLGSCLENSRNLRQLRLPNDQLESSEALEDLPDGSLPLLELFEGRSDDIVELGSDGTAPVLKRLRYIPHKDGDSSLEEVQSTLKVLEGRPLTSFAYETLFTMDFLDIVSSLAPFKNTLSSLAIGNTNALAPPELTLEERLVGEIRFSCAFIDHLPNLVSVTLTYASEKGMPDAPSGNSGSTTKPDGQLATYFDRVAALWYKQSPFLMGLGFLFVDGSRPKAWHSNMLGVDTQGESLNIEDSWSRFRPVPQELAISAIQGWTEEM